MYSKKYKGRCVKKRISKCKEVVRCYDDIMLAFLDTVESTENIIEVYCNVLLDDFVLGEYTTDFVYTLKSGETVVRECVFRKKLSNHITVKWLDASRSYWLARGVTNWGIVIDAEK